MICTYGRCVIVIRLLGKFVESEIIFFPRFKMHIFCWRGEGSWEGGGGKKKSLSEESVGVVVLVSRPGEVKDGGEIALCKKKTRKKTRKKTLGKNFGKKNSRKKNLEKKIGKKQEIENLHICSFHQKHTNTNTNTNTQR